MTSTRYRNSEQLDSAADYHEFINHNQRGVIPASIPHSVAIAFAIQQQFHAPGDFYMLHVDIKVPITRLCGFGDCFPEVATIVRAEWRL